jgi:hypothetical protein
MVILTVKDGVTRQQIMNIMPAEVRATVKLYLDGKIRQWYSVKRSSRASDRCVQHVQGRRGGRANSEGRLVQHSATLQKSVIRTSEQLVVADECNVATEGT